MSLKPSDSLSLSWYDPPASSSAGSRTARDRPSSYGGSGSGTGRIDPASMGAAGARAAPSEPRGIHVPRASGEFRESAKLALFGGGPERPPNTPTRGVGGNSSMAGILSTPEAVPQSLPTAQRSSGKAGLGAGTRTSIQFDDNAPAAGFRPAAESHTGRSVDRPNSRYGPHGAGGNTRSNVSMSSDLDSTPLHTGKAITHRAGRGDTAMTSIGAAEDATPRRPLTAASGQRNRSQVLLGDEAPAAALAAPSESHHQRGASGAGVEMDPSAAGSPTERHAAGVALRPGTAQNRSSDIFFLQGANDQTAPAQPKDATKAVGKAHVPPLFQSTDSDGLPNLYLQSSRKNASSADSPFGNVPTGVVVGGAAGEVDESQAAGYTAPPQSNGSMIPQLKFGGIHSSSARPQSVASARPSTAGHPDDGVTVAGVAGSSVAPGHATRRAYGNAKNSSSLFAESSSLAGIQPTPQLPKQIPDLPPPAKHHLKIVRHGTANSVQGLLQWD